MSANEPGRIQIHGEGVGQIGDEEVKQRAEELARMDGRAVAHAQDLYRAREELTKPGPPPPPEADETETPVASWSKGPASRGHRGVHTETDDGQEVAERLVQEGLEEAERDRRLASSDEES